MFKKNIVMFIYIIIKNRIGKMGHFALFKKFVS